MSIPHALVSIAAVPIDTRPISSPTSLPREGGIRVPRDETIEDPTHSRL